MNKNFKNIWLLCILITLFIIGEGVSKKECIIKYKPYFQVYKANVYIVINRISQLINENITTMTEKDAFANNIIKPNIIEYETIASMKLANLPPNQKVLTSGYYNKEDGGAGEYIIRLKRTMDKDDGGRIIFLENGNVAELINDGTVRPEQFGAKGDGITNDEAAFRNMFDSGIDTIVLDSKTYLLDLTDNMTIDGKYIIGNNSTLKKKEPAPNKLKRIDITGQCFFGNIRFLEAGYSGIGRIYDCHDTVFENCKWESYGFEYNVDSLINLYSNNQRITFRNCYVHLETKEKGGIWIRELGKNLVTEGVHFIGCKIESTTLDETVAIWGSHGIVKNIFFDDCNIVRDERINNTTGSFISIGENSGITQNVFFNNCYLECKNNSVCLVRSATKANIECENVCFNNCFLKEGTALNLAHGVISGVTDMVFNDCKIYLDRSNCFCYNPKATLKGCTVVINGQTKNNVGTYEDCHIKLNGISDPLGAAFSTKGYKMYRSKIVGINAGIHINILYDDCEIEIVDSEIKGICTNYFIFDKHSNTKIKLHNSYIPQKIYLVGTNITGNISNCFFKAAVGNQTSNVILEGNTNNFDY